METVNPTDFARICGVTKQAIFKALSDGVIPFTPVGKKKMIDINSPAAQMYMNAPGRKLCLDIPSKKREEKPPITPRPAKLPNIKTIDYRSPSANDDESLYELNNRAKHAEARIKEAKAAALEKKLLPIDFIEDGLFRYIEKLNSNIERSASIFISEVGQRILESGEIMPEHTEKFVSMILNLIHETKINIRKEIEKYEPNV